MNYSVDPGAKECFAVRWNEHGSITGACITDEILPMRKNDIVVCEEMRVRPGGKYAQDLVYVSRMSGIVCALGTPVWVAPETWKGQVPKEVHQRTRILPRLTASDMNILEKACGRRKSLLHNLIDAAGIGLWWLDKQGIQR